MENTLSKKKPLRLLQYRHFLLPGLIPRFVELLSSGFGSLAYYMAYVFACARLLPLNHPYLSPANKGQYGIRHVLSQGAENLVFEWKNIDRILIYFTILAGIVLLALQIVLFAFTLWTGQEAMAQSADGGNTSFIKSIFGANANDNYDPAQDIAFMTLDRVFGVRGIFNSCLSNGGPCVDSAGNTVEYSGVPNAFHLALNSLFQFFSVGIFIVSTIIILYFVVTIVGETAVTGSPFGQRVNKTWLPVRLILFFALLIPLNLGGNGSAGGASISESRAGLNAAQLITLWTAKIGSNFATNGWMRFNGVVELSFTDKANEIVASPNAPNIGPLIKFVFLARTCKAAEEIAFSEDYRAGTERIDAYIVRSPRLLNLGGDGTGESILARKFSEMDYEEAAKFSNYGSIEIVFGKKYERGKDDSKLSSYKGNIIPYCGHMTIVPQSAGALGFDGTNRVYEIYYQLLGALWQDPDIANKAMCFADEAIAKISDSCKKLTFDYAKTTIVDKYQAQFKNYVPEFVAEQFATDKWGVDKDVIAKGWVGAGLWYNKVADLNGNLNAALQTLPKITSMPDVMEAASEAHKAAGDNPVGANLYAPDLPAREGEVRPEIDFKRKGDDGKAKEVATALHKAYQFWTTDELIREGNQKPTGYALHDALNLIFGTEGLFNLRNEHNENVHPLAQLSMMGSGLIYAALRNYTLGLATEMLGGIDSPASGLAKAAANLFNTAFMTTAAIGFVLYYVLPLLPFLYFFLAFGGWIKTIFEAMAAMPLWALGHIISIDGPGMVGPSAKDGYFLLLDILTRPFLILIGYIGGILLFGALVTELNNVFDLVVENVAGFDESTATEDTISMMVSPVSEFFYTLLYAIVVYVIGLNSFKLIEQVPKDILRFMDFTTPTFQDIDTSIADSVLQKSYVSSNLIAGKMSGTGKGLLEAFAGGI